MNYQHKIRSYGKDIISGRHGPKKTNEDLNTLTLNLSSELTLFLASESWHEVTIISHNSACFHYACNSRIANLLTSNISYQAAGHITPDYQEMLYLSLPSYSIK